MEEYRTFDTIVITPVGIEVDGYMVATCFGYNNDDEDHKMPLGVIDCFTTDSKCQFDFYKDGKSIVVFNKRYDNHKVYMPNSFTGRFYGV